MTQIIIGLNELIGLIFGIVVPTIASIFAVRYDIMRRFDKNDIKFTWIVNRLISIEDSNVTFMGHIIDDLKDLSSIYKEISDYHISNLSHKKIMSLTYGAFSRLSQGSKSVSNALVRSHYRMVEDVNTMKTKGFLDFHSTIIMTEKGEKIINELSSVKDLIDERIKEIAGDILREEKLCQDFGEQSKLILLRRLILMTDHLLYYADIKPKNFRAVSELLKKEGYIIDVTLPINISFLIYILREAVKQNLIPPEMLNLIDEANKQYSKFVER